MIFYQTKTKKLPETNYSEVRKHALFILNQIKRKTKRRPYIRSAYFDKQKIFFDYFWIHLAQKNLREKIRRIKYLPCTIDLIRNSKIAPTSIENADNRNEMLHRFVGKTKDKEVFFVQIKENKKNGKKYLMSCFPQK
jgi:hypothetical protein